MTTPDAIRYVLGSATYTEVYKCHRAMLASLQTEAERELVRFFPCVNPISGLQPEDKALWNKAVGFLTGAMYLRSGDGRAMFTQIKERLERPVSNGTDVCEKTYKSVDVDALADRATADAYSSMAQITCVSQGRGGAGRRASLAGRSGKNRTGNCLR